MDPFVTASLVSAGSNLLGGLFGSDDTSGAQKALQRTFDRNRPKWIRQGAEAAGFNPLVFAAPGGLAGGVSTAPSMMGESIARAGMALGDGMQASERLKMEKAQLEVENERLAQIAENTKLTANPSPIYQKRRQDGGGTVVTGGGTKRTEGPDAVTPTNTFGIEFDTPKVNEPTREPLTLEVKPSKNSKPYRIFNPDLFDTGLSELAGGLLTHGAGWAVDRIGNIDVKETVDTTLNSIKKNVKDRVERNEKERKKSGKTWRERWEESQIPHELRK